MMNGEITLNATIRVVVGAPPVKAERLPEDPRVGLVHSFSGLDVRTLVFVPPELAFLATDEGAP